MGIAIGRDGGNVLDFLLALDWDRELLETFNDGINSELDSSPEIHWVHASGDGFASLLEDGSGQDGSGGGSITSLVVSLRGNLLDKAGSDVVVSIGEFDLLSDSDSIFGDLWGTESLVNDNVSSSRAKGDLDGIGEHVNALEHLGPSLSSELDFFAKVCNRVLSESRLTLHQSGDWNS